MRMTGIHFEKPSLHLVEYNGSTANNIISPNVGGVLLDPWSGKKRHNVPSQYRIGALLANDLLTGRPTKIDS